MGRVFTAGGTGSLFAHFGRDTGRLVLYCDDLWNRRNGTSLFVATLLNTTLELDLMDIPRFCRR